MLLNKCILPRNTVRFFSKIWCTNSNRCLQIGIPRQLRKVCAAYTVPERSSLAFQRRYYSQQPSTDVKLDNNAGSASIINNGKQIEVDWKDGNISRVCTLVNTFALDTVKTYRVLFLNAPVNDNMPVLTTSVNRSSNMGQMIVSDLPTSFTISSLELTGDGLIRVTFEEENHFSEFTLDWLKKNCYSKESLDEKKKAVRPVIKHQSKISELPYPEVAESEEGLYRWLKLINEDGLCLLKDVPTGGNYLFKLIERVGPIMKNLYGEIYDVVVTQNPINAAYSNFPLEYHMDLQFYESPPGLQFLHCFRFDKDISGGETTFLDMMEVAEGFRVEHPDKFDLLSKVPCPFQRIHSARDHPVEIVTSRPIIALNNEKEIIGISWHANLHGPLAVPEEYVEPFYKAYQLFAKAMKKSTVKPIRLEPGDLISFNNRRMAHGRNSFDDTSEGKRHLQGAYLNIDDFRSTLAILHRKYGDGTAIKRVGNHDWF